jgi:hypothetical protein
VNVTSKDRIGRHAWWIVVAVGMPLYVFDKVQPFGWGPPHSLDLLVNVGLTRFPGQVDYAASAVLCW